MRERERIHSIVDEMEAEDQTTIEMEEYEGSYDDEQYSLLKEWKEHGFGNHVAEDVQNQEWEYRGNEVVQGATYPDHHTYSEGHVRAQQRAKRVRHPRGG